MKWQKPSDACSGRGERELDGPVAKTTRSAGAEPRAVCYSPEHGRAAALRAHSEAPSRAAQTALALEFRQAARMRLRAVLPFFFLGLTQF